MSRYFLLISLLFAFFPPSAPSQSQPKSVQASAQNDLELFPVAVSRKLGYIDVHGRIVIPLNFSIYDPNGYFHEEQYFQDGLAIVSDGKQSGFIDQTGRFIIRGPYHPLKHFSDGLAQVADSDNLIGFIDKTGKFVVPPQFDRAEDFVGERAVVQIHGKWGYIDRTGRLVISTRFEDAESFQNGYAGVNISSVRRGYIDDTGKFLTMPDEVEDFRRPSEGLMAVKIEKKWGFMNMLGQVVIAPQFEPDLDETYSDRYDGVFENGLAIAKQNGKVGFIDKAGRFLIPPKFEKAWPFQGDLARVRVNGKWGLINCSGEEVAAPKFAELDLFVEDRAVASIDGIKYGYLDRRGHMVIPARFNEAKRFSEGLACVKKELQVDGKTTWLWGYIDGSGQWVINPQFTYHGYFHRGLARQMIFEYVGKTLNQPGYRNEWGYIDRAGKFVWKSTD